MHSADVELAAPARDERVVAVDEHARPLLGRPQVIAQHLAGGRLDARRGAFRERPRRNLARVTPPYAWSLAGPRDIAREQTSARP
jgi:hypothetical protein